MVGTWAGAAAYELSVPEPQVRSRRRVSVRRQAAAQGAAEGLVSPVVGAVPTPHLDQLFDRREFARVQGQLGVTFSVDAYCNQRGSNALCPRYATPAQPLTSMDLAGQALWCDAPTDLVRNYQQHYERCKARDPKHTCALFVVPKRPHLDRYFRQKWYSLVHEYPKGTQLYTTAQSNKATQLTPTESIVQLWYDPPAATASLNAVGNYGNTMIFDAKSAGHQVTILVDSGADTKGAADGFVGKALAHSLGLARQPANTASVRLANGSEQVLLGQVCMPVQVGPFRDTIRLLVMDAAVPTADILLGADWLRRRKGVQSWEKDTLTVTKGSQRVYLVPNYAAHRQPAVAQATACTASPDEAPELPCLSGKQLVKAMRKQLPSYLMFVQVDKGDPGTPSKGGGAVLQTAEAAVSHPDLVPEGTMSALLTEYADVFKELEGMPQEREGITHTIPLVPDTQPPSKRMYRLSPLEKEECKRQITELLKQELIEPSSSPYGAPVIFVKKADGSLRMCLDYRALNKITVKRQYPMPHIQELFDRLQGARVFSSLDLQQGYHQIQIPKEDVPKTAFMTPFGQYAYKVLCFGLTNAPSTFQEAMNRVFAGCEDFVLVYLDDIMVFSKTPEEHVQHLRKVLSLLRQNKFQAKLPKCDFNKAELKFLGHIVGREGIKVDPRKVQAVKEWPEPTGPSPLRSFLGLANFFRRFIQGYSSLVAPLTALTSAKTPWNWTDQCRRAFEGVKRALTQAPVLILPDLGKPFEVYSDASIHGTGAVLLQDQKAVAYSSHRFTPAERNYTTTDQEALGVINALREWRCYLEGAPDVTVYTDHQPLTHLHGLKSADMLSRRQARWVEFLQDQKVNWSYKPGRINVADPLSRMYEEFGSGPHSSTPGQPTGYTITCTAVSSDIRNRITQGYKHDPYLKKPATKQLLRLDASGLWYRDDQVVVPDVEQWRDLLLAEFHDGGTGGHRGPERTKEAIQRVYWWPGLDAAI